ncbi:MAG: hypothetical protein HKO07_08990, partial [Pseudomonadales bacterium]|nr:hypothetical protein [Pseudomonadales bacterium]
DNQVKIRGYRIELGEIESLLRDEDSVAEVAVLLREDVPGDQRLIAYIRANEAGQLPIEELKSALARQLPSFMVPAHFVQLQSLPLTPNGKVDRNALPRPDYKPKGANAGKAPNQDRQSAAAHTPASEIESLVLSVWKRALGVGEIAADENFFDIGGHSLLVIQVLKDLREQTGQRIQMTDLFRYTTVTALANFLGADSTLVETKRSTRAAARKARRNKRS